MKHKVCVVTGSRAEFGLLKPLLVRLNKEENIELHLVVTGSHLSKSFGNTQNEIEKSGISINIRIVVPLNGDSKTDMAQATGSAISLFAEYFTEYMPELLVILGDRFEIFAAATAAAILTVPIAHLHGGEITAGAIDEFLRHSITKMSCLHFTACEEYRRRVIQLGEAPERVFNVGALGVENIKSLNLLSLQELQKSLGFDLEDKSFSVVTFHPVTLEDNNSKEQHQELIKAMNEFSEMNYIITKANADAGGRLINQLWDEEAKKHKNWLVVSSLGVVRYLSALKYSAMMLGNSSSGIIEAPALHVPTVNIGNRQKGRMMAESIICCAPLAEEISGAMIKAQSPEHKAMTKAVICPFGKGDTSQRILTILNTYLSQKIDIKKEFYDLTFTV